jgi:hypothetical protein
LPQHTKHLTPYERKTVPPTSHPENYYKLVKGAYITLPLIAGEQIISTEKKQQETSGSLVTLLLRRYFKFLSFDCINLKLNGPFTAAIVWPHSER